MNLFANIPDELLKLIFSNLDHKSLTGLKPVTKKFKLIAENVIDSKTKDNNTSILIAHPDEDDLLFTLFILKDNVMVFNTVNFAPKEFLIEIMSNARISKKALIDYCKTIRNNGMRNFTNFLAEDKYCIKPPIVFENERLRDSLGNKDDKIYTGNGERDDDQPLRKTHISQNRI